MAALKIFDPELIERFGEAKQRTRIERELSLRGEHHKHLVEIYDGGHCPSSGYYYVVMSYIAAPNLASVIGDIPRDRVWPIIAQIAAACKFLETKRIAHRDVKPENIVISRDFEDATLLDLGVIRPFGEAGLTDEDQRVFIGTLRYASPEFLWRTEEDTEEGWRALTFYQIGAVLHDLIMRTRIFNEFWSPTPAWPKQLNTKFRMSGSSEVVPRIGSISQELPYQRPCTSLEIRRLREDFEVKTSHDLSPLDAKDRIP